MCVSVSLVYGCAAWAPADGSDGDDDGEEELSLRGGEGRCADESAVAAELKEMDEIYEVLAKVRQGVQEVAAAAAACSGDKQQQQQHTATRAGAGGAGCLSSSDGAGAAGEGSSGSTAASAAARHKGRFSAACRKHGQRKLVSCLSRLLL